MASLYNEGNSRLLIRYHSSDPEHSQQRNIENDPPVSVFLKFHYKRERLMEKIVKIGTIQMQVQFHNPQKNLDHAENLIAQAVSLGAEICVLPECMDLGWATPEAPSLAQPIPGAVSDRLCRIAQAHKVWLVCGLTEREDNRIFNTAILICPNGTIRAKHRKINILTDVEYMYSVGDRLSVAETPFGRIGIAICADNLSPSLCLGHSLARMGAQMILSPSAWAVTPDRDETTHPYGQEWHVPYQTLSGLYRIPVVGVSNVGAMPAGVWAGWKAIGNSIAYDSDGTCAAVLPYGPNAEAVRVIALTVRQPRTLGTELAQAVYNNTCA